VVIAAILAALMLTGAAGASSARFETIDYWFSGSAYQARDAYSNTSQGLQLDSRETVTVTFVASCREVIEAVRVRAGEPLLCNASRHTMVLGRIEDEYPNHPQMDCVGTIRFRPGATWYLGGTLGTGNLIRTYTAAPFAAPQLVVTNDNPLEQSCSSIGLYSPDPVPGEDKSFGVNKDLRYPSGSESNAWMADLGTDLTPGHVMFSAELIDDARLRPSRLNHALDAVKDALSQWWNAAQDLSKGFPSTVTIQVPSVGTLQATWTAADSPGHTRDSRTRDSRTRDSRTRDSRTAKRAGTVLFRVDQRVRAGAVALRPRITPLGQAVLAGTASAPVLRATLTFTPAHGSRVTITGTFKPQVAPAISSVQFAGTPVNPTIIVRGSGLAPLPPTFPIGSPAGHNGCPAESGDYGSDYGTQLNVNDVSKGWAAGLSFQTNNDCIGLIPTKVTASEIDLRLGSFYTDLYPKFSLSNGDQAQVVVNGAPIEVYVSYGAPVTS
jgi:hypothetical protein